MTREEHLAWCKERALEYWRAGDLQNAVASMGSDLGKHPETQPATSLLALGMMFLIRQDAKGVHDWIVGFR